MTFPLLAHRLDTWVDPADAFVTLFGAGGDAVWLDSGPDATEGRSFLGTGSVTATASAAAGTVTVGGVTSPGRIIDALRDDLASRPRPEPGGYPVGWWGRFGYEAGASAAGVPVSTEGEGSTDAALLLVDRLLCVDHAARTTDLVAPDTPDGRAWIAETAASLTRAAGASAAYLAAHPLPPAVARWRHDDDAYLAAIAACQDAIRAGDAYQLCLTNRAEARTDADPLAVHLRLRELSPAPHAGFVRVGGEVLVSSSPEQFLRVEADGRVRTRPIKGTRPRGATVASDLELRADLEASEKERAENVMIVDLMRNEIARVSKPGTVGVTSLLAVESYAQVHQLVSTVRGELLEGLDGIDAIRACFPAGSMTGAPKLSATQILEGLEARARGVYSGVFGYVGLDGTVDLAMVIRSMVMDADGTTIGTGGGITALSVPEEELAEAKLKAAVLLEVLGVR